MAVSLSRYAPVRFKLSVRISGTGHGPLTVDDLEASNRCGSRLVTVTARPRALLSPQEKHSVERATIGSSGLDSRHHYGDSDVSGPGFARQFQPDGVQYLVIRPVWNLFSFVLSLSPRTL